MMSNSKLEEVLKDKLDANKLEIPKKRFGEKSGCISKGQCYIVDGKEKIFVKSQLDVHSAKMFIGEYESLKTLKLTNTIRVPKPMICLPKYENYSSAIVTEYLDISEIDDNSTEQLGKDLANLHDYNRKHLKYEEQASKWVGKIRPSIKHLQERFDLEQSFSKHTLESKVDNTTASKNSEIFVPSSDLKPMTFFGFHVPTSCGLVPRPNEWTEDWVSFYSRYRLDVTIRDILSEYQDRELQERWSSLQLKIGRFFEDLKYNEKIIPSLLHGDLWSGNMGRLNSNESVVYDPCSFYGHSEYEFAIMQMFGSISESVERSYFSEIPRSRNYLERKPLYQLFHYLNHWNHFGSEYCKPTLDLMKQLDEQQ